VQAAVDKVLDFSEADSSDPKWNLKLQFCLTALNRRNLRESTLAELHLPLLSMLSMDALVDPEKRQAHRDRLLDLLLRFRESYSLDPKAISTTEDRKKTETRKDVAAWESVYGSLKDPETKRKIAALEEGLKKMMEQPEAGPARISTTDNRLAAHQLQKLLQERTASHG
jgi:hypothetical protein